MRFLETEMHMCHIHIIQSKKNVILNRKTLYSKSIETKQMYQKSSLFIFPPFQQVPPLWVGSGGFGDSVSG